MMEFGVRHQPYYHKCISSCLEDMVGIFWIFGTGYISIFWICKTRDKTQAKKLEEDRRITELEEAREFQMKMLPKSFQIC